MGGAFDAAKKLPSIESLMQSEGIAWAIRSPDGFLLSDFDFTEQVISEAKGTTEKGHAAQQAFQYLKLLSMGAQLEVTWSMKALVANQTLMQFLWQTVTGENPGKWATNRLSAIHVSLVSEGLDALKYPLPNRVI